MKFARIPALAPGGSGARSGFAVSVFVLAVMAVMGALLLSIPRTVATLDRELR